MLRFMKTLADKQSMLIKRMRFKRYMYHISPFLMRNSYYLIPILIFSILNRNVIYPGYNTIAMDTI